MFSKTTIVGRLGTDPVLNTESKTHCKFNVAVNQFNGREKSVMWYRVVCFGNTAENCAKYLQKGKLCLVEGRLQESSYKTKSGDTKKSISLLADTVVFLSHTADLSQPAVANEQNNEPFTQDGDAIDDIPF